MGPNKAVPGCRLLISLVLCCGNPAPTNPYSRSCTQRYLPGSAAPDSCFQDGKQVALLPCIYFFWPFHPYFLLKSHIGYMILLCPCCRCNSIAANAHENSYQ